MSTRFFAEGNIGSPPEFREFPAPDNEEPHRLLRLSVYFDNPIPRDGELQDRGGFWAPVELWHSDAEHWSGLYQKGMRVLVDGRMVRDDWEDGEGTPRTTFKVEARCVAVLPYRIERIVITPKPAADPEPQE